MQINTKFDLYKKVYIKDLKLMGKILAINITSYIEYQVRYFDKVEPRTVWFNEDELALEETPDKIGF